MKNLEEFCSTEDLLNGNRGDMKKWHTRAIEDDEFFSGDDEATVVVARELESSRAAVREENEVKRGK